MNGTSAISKALPIRAERSAASQALQLLVVVVAYYAGCRAGFGLRFPDSGISFFWPPTAILTATLLLSSRRSWAAIMVASFVAHAIAHAENGIPIGAWPIQFLGNGAQALIAAYAVRRSGGVDGLFTDAPRVLIFILGACLLAPAIASLIPGLVYVKLGWAPDFAMAWRDRSITNAVASLTLLPSLIIAGQYVIARGIAVPARAGEYSIILAGILGAHLLTGSSTRVGVLGLCAMLYAPVPLLWWATVRFGAASAFALLWTTLLATINITSGNGPLAGLTPADAVLAVQLMIAASAVPMMLCAGLIEHSRAEHRALVDAEQQNSAILRALPDLMFVMLRDGTFVDYHARNRSALFVDPSAFIGRKVRQVLPAPVAEVLMGGLARAVRSDEPAVVDYELTIGEPRFFEARIVRLDSERLLSVVRDVTEPTRASELNRDLARRLISRQEEERQRIARELHDDISQRIAALNIEIGRIAKQAGMEQSRERLGELSALASEIAVDVHHVSYELHPSRLRTIGLLPALEALCRETAAKHDLDIAFTHNETSPPAAVNISLPLYRIVQEALHNIVRHSHARNAHVSVSVERAQLVLQIADTGVGFDATQTQQTGLGLVSMRERVALLNGEMVVDSAPGGGTRITVRIPA